VVSKVLPLGFKRLNDAEWLLHFLQQKDFNFEMWLRIWSSKQGQVKDAEKKKMRGLVSKSPLRIVNKMAKTMEVATERYS